MKLKTVLLTILSVFVLVGCIVGGYFAINALIQKSDGNHTHTREIMPAVEASCTTTGLTAGIKCATCNTVLKAQEVTPALGHTAHAIEAVPATCTTPGTTAGISCVFCGAMIQAPRAIPAVGHIPATIDGYAATCTTPGMSRTSMCEVCNVVLKVPEVIPAFGHDPVPIQATAATCTTPGLTAGEKCSLCDAVLTAQEVIPVLEHDFEEIPGTAPTCTENGSTRGAKCATCDTVFLEPEELPATGHIYEEIPVVPATCTENGSTRGAKCATCGTVFFEPDVIPARGHYTQSVESEHGCGDAYTVTTSCTRCDYVKVENCEAPGHTYDYYSNKCTVCDAEAFIFTEISENSGEYYVSAAEGFKAIYGRLEIPNSVTVDDKNYIIVGISDGGFANTNVSTVSIVQLDENFYVGVGAFAGCKLSFVSSYGGDWNFYQFNYKDVYLAEGETGENYYIVFEYNDYGGPQTNSVCVSDMQERPYASE